MKALYKSLSTILITGALMSCSVSAVDAPANEDNQQTSQQEASGKPLSPNVIIILTDDQGYQDVGFNGSEDIFTPNIDRIANEGARFTQGYVTFSVCGPSRAGLLTGRHQERFGFSFNPTIDPSVPQNGIPTSEKNIAEVLAPGGYRSGIIGKWHMGTHEDLRPNKRGFDYFYGFLSGGHSYFPELLTLNDLSEVKHKWDWYRTRLLRNEQRIDIDEYLTDELSHEAVDFIKREKDNPFFLYLAYNAPHGPLEATEEYLQRNTHIKDKKRRTYAAMVTAVDDGVGRVLDTLKETGIDENTIVFFLSDNGGPEHVNASDNGELKGGKNSLFEGGVRVPFAMRWPGKVPAGMDYTKAVSSLDILATVVAQTAIDTSENKPLDGVNLMPFLSGENTGMPHETLYWRHLKSNALAIRKGSDKFIQQDGETVLYNLEQDISESTDIKSEHKQVHKSLSDEINQWQEALPAPAFPDNKWKDVKGNPGKGKNKKKRKVKNNDKA